MSATRTMRATLAAAVAVGVLAGCQTPRPQIHYTEVVCRDVAAQCTALERTHGLSFGPADADLGNARVARAADGSLVGVRAPMAAHEQPIVRTYLAVHDIDRALVAAQAAGGVVAYGPMQQGDTGTWAIWFLGDLQFGLWMRQR